MKPSHSSDTARIWKDRVKTSAQVLVQESISTAMRTEIVQLRRCCFGIVGEGAVSALLQFFFFSFRGECIMHSSQEGIATFVATFFKVSHRFLRPYVADLFYITTLLRSTRTFIIFPRSHQESVRRKHVISYIVEQVEKSCTKS